MLTPMQERSAARCSTRTARCKRRESSSGLTDLPAAVAGPVVPADLSVLERYLSHSSFAWTELDH